MGRISGCVAGMSVKIEGYGTIPGLGRVLYAPLIARNLISVAQLDEDGFDITFKANECVVTSSKENASFNINGIKKNGHYECEIPVRNRGDDISIRTMSNEEAKISNIFGSCYMLKISCNRASVDSGDRSKNSDYPSTTLSQSLEILSDPIGNAYELIVDSGCSEHMFNTCSQLCNYEKYAPRERSVIVANGSIVPVEGYGRCGILKRVYCIPQLSHSLLSVSSLTYDGIVVLFKDDYAIIIAGKSGLSFDPIRARRKDNLYKIDLLQFEMCTKIPYVYCLAHLPAGEEAMQCYLLSESARTDPISMVHYTFGHPSASRTRHICKCNNLPGIRKLEMKAFDFLKNCEFCRLAKEKRNSFSGTVARPSVIGKHWYADVKGPFEKPSLVHENVYVFGIIEAKTRFLMQFYIKKKSDVGKCIVSWYETYIQALRISAKGDEQTHIFLNTDMGESTSNNIIDYLSSKGVTLSTTCPHTPEQNMVIERVWRTIGESAKAMLPTANLSEVYWEEARKTACYLYNRSPNAHEELTRTHRINSIMEFHPIYHT